MSIAFYLCAAVCERACLLFAGQFCLFCVSLQFFLFVRLECFDFLRICLECIFHIDVHMMSDMPRA